MKEEVVALPKAPKKLDLRQGKYEAPSWNIGDKWIYRDEAGSTWANEVMDIMEDLYIVKNEKERDLYAYDKKTLNLKFIIGSSGRRVRSTYDFKQLLNFPMFVGKKWSDTATKKIPQLLSNVEGNFNNEFIIQDVEDVNTPAGKFTVYKIYWKQTLLTAIRDPGMGSVINSGWARVWYSPEAKAVVKEEYEKTVFWGDAKDKELISYKLK